MASGSAPAVLALLGVGGLAAAWILRSKPEQTPAAGADPSPDTVAPDEPSPSSSPSSSSSSSRDRAAVVAAAEGEIGQQDPAKYWEEVLPPEKQGLGFEGHWCGGFALWCLRQAGLARGLNWEIGKGFCFRLPQTNDPKPGDVGYIDQPFQHHAVIVEALPDRVVSVDGNQAGSSVKMVTRPRDAFTAFYSIEPLLEQVTA